MTAMHRWELNRKGINLKREFRINQIMVEKKVDRNTAEKMFISEVCEKYGTNNFKLAFQMFSTDVFKTKLIN